MQALTLLIVFVLTAITIQFTGFLISRVVEYQYPNVGLMTFLILFFVAFGLAWPIAVRIAEWLIRWRGYVVETERFGGDVTQENPFVPTTRAAEVLPPCSHACVALKTLASYIKTAIANAEGANCDG